jgi:amino acid permease
VQFVRILIWQLTSSKLTHFVDGLAASGNAPKFFLKTTRNGLPYVAVLFCAAFSLLAFMAVSKGAGNVFQWFSNMTAIAGLMTWFGISVTYLRFYKGMQVQGIDRKTLPYYTNLQPYAAWWGVVSTLTVCFVCRAFISANTVQTDYSFTLSSSADGASSSMESGALLLSSPTTSSLLLGQ